MEQPISVLVIAGRAKCAPTIKLYITRPALSQFPSLKITRSANSTKFRNVVRRIRELARVGRDVRACVNTSERTYGEKDSNKTRIFSEASELYAHATIYSRMTIQREAAD